MRHHDIAEILEALNHRIFAMRHDVVLAERQTPPLSEIRTVVQARPLWGTRHERWHVTVRCWPRRITATTAPLATAHAEIAQRSDLRAWLELALPRVTHHAIQTLMGQPV